MVPIALNGGKGVSLTKNYNFGHLASAIGQLDAGMAQNEVEERLGRPHAELADDLFLYDSTGGLIDDVLVHACKLGKREGPLLAWVALLLADQRLQEIVTYDLTTADGLLDPAMFSKAAVTPIVANRYSGTSVDKAASNLLRWLETSGIAVPRRSGSSIVALERTQPTAYAVPQILAMLRERLNARGIVPTRAPDGIADLALGIGVNRWVNLTQDEFRVAAAGPPAVVAPKVRRVALPAGLERLDDELSRKRQVVLQGPPGTGKTFVARAYIDWFAAGERAASRVSEIAARLPQAERVPSRIADEIQQRGVVGAWEIVQFHPGYSYERFVRGLQSTPVPGGVAFEPVDRLFGTLAAVARELDERGDSAEVLLLIDEINRGDIAKIFGELLYGLEYRDEPVTTPYAIAGDPTLTIPSRLRLLGTMNTADQSIAMVDKALRRRFAWITCRPRREVITAHSGFADEEDRNAALWLFDRVSSMFDVTDPEQARLQIGHAYFLPDRPAATVEAGLSALAQRFAMEVWPLLEEYEAEGLIDAELLTQLIAEAGWRRAERPTDQAELLIAVLARLRALRP